MCEVKVDLAQPRNRTDPAFQALVESIYVHMAGGTTVHAQRESLFAGNGIGMVLPLTSTNALAGLIEAVDNAPYGGQADLRELATALRSTSGDLFRWQKCCN